MRVLDEIALDRVKDYIHNFQRMNGASPTYRQIEQNVKGFDNLDKVHRYVNVLAQRGFIEKSSDGKIELPHQLNPGSSSLAMMIGAIPCGPAEIMQDEIEHSYAIPDDLFGRGEKYLMTAKGDSMIEVGIMPGDLLVVERAIEANNKDIVVAEIEAFGDSEATAKTYIKLGDGKVMLRPENSNMDENEWIFEEHQVGICGIVVGVMRSYVK